MKLIRSCKIGLVVDMVKDLLLHMAKFLFDQNKIAGQLKKSTEDRINFKFLYIYIYIYIFSVCNLQVAQTRI
jgi:hypothetical protein